MFLFTINVMLINIQNQKYNLTTVESKISPLVVIAICGTSPMLLGGQVCQLVLLSTEELHVSFPGGVTNSINLTNSRTQKRRKDIRATRYRPTNLPANRWQLGRYDPYQEGIVTPPYAATNIQTRPLSYILGFGTFPRDLLAGWTLVLGD